MIDKKFQIFIDIYIQVFFTIFILLIFDKSLNTSSPV